jgi:hypothetical protein
MSFSDCLQRKLSQADTAHFQSLAPGPHIIRPAFNMEHEQLNNWVSWHIQNLQAVKDGYRTTRT